MTHTRTSNDRDDTSSDVTAPDVIDTLSPELRDKFATLGKISGTPCALLFLLFTFAMC